MKKRKNVLKVERKLFNVLVVATLIAGMPKFTSFAAEAHIVTDEITDNHQVEVLEATILDDVGIIVPYTMLADCVITARGASDGMHIDISTGTVGKASVLGIKDVKILKKTWYGGWTTVAVCSGSESYDRGTMGISILYANAEKGSTYRITCVHYGNVDGYIEGTNDSGEIYFTY